MNSEDAQSADARDAQRVIAFSDAVVAIAITLIVLPLVNSAQALGAERLSEYFADQYPALIAASVSFVTIALFWNGHRRIYRNALSVPAGASFLNMVWLGSIVAIPIATAINVAYAGANRGALLLYVGTITATHALGLLQQDVIQRNDPGQPPSPISSRLASWSAVVLLLIGMLAIALFGWVGSLALVLLLLDIPIRRLTRRGGLDIRGRGREGAGPR